MSKKDFERGKQKGAAAFSGFMSSSNGRLVVYIILLVVGFMAGQAAAVCP